MQGKLVVFSGPSGVGKGTIRENLQKDIILRKSIKDPEQLQKLLNLIMSNPGIRISLNKHSKQLQINIVTLKN